MRGTVGRQPADRDRERADAAGQVGPRQGIPAHLKEEVPADGGPRGPEYPGHYLGEEEQSPSLLSFMAEEQDIKVSQSY